jgi:hypothetical protein
MGLFDIFSSKKKSAPPASPSSAAPKAEKADKNVARLGKVAGDKHAQNYDRLEAIEALSRIQSSEAAAALLRRFTFYIEPSITDQEEKEIAFHGIVACGEEAIEPIVNFCERADSLNWPLKILREVMTPEGFLEETVQILDGFDTDYARNVDPKIQLLGALETESREAALRFLEDVSEPVRFQAVLTLLSANHELAVPRLVELAIDEESVRIRNKIAEGISFKGWVVPAELRDRFSGAVYGGGFSLDGDGKVRGR